MQGRVLVRQAGGRCQLKDVLSCPGSLCQQKWPSLDPGRGSCASGPPGCSQAGCHCHCVPLNATPWRYCLRSSSVCLAACWMFAGSLAWLFIGFCGACAQLSKRMLVPSRVCTKHLGASLNKQPQPCSARCQLSWAAPGEGRAKSLPAKESGKNSCLINKSIGN